MREVQYFFRCDVCKKSLSDASPLAVVTKKAKAKGWKIKACRPSRHVCPDCFAQMVDPNDKATRARMAVNGESGETVRELAHEFGVFNQTIMNWATGKTKRIGQPGRPRRKP